MKQLFFSLFLFISIPSIAQTIATDSKGKSVLEYPVTKSFSLPVSSANNSISGAGTFKIGSGTQKYIIPKHHINAIDSLTQNIKPRLDPLINQDSANFTVGKSWCGVVGLGISNLLSNLASSETQPTYSLTLGIQRNVDIINNWENLKKTGGWFLNYGASFLVQVDFVRPYDTISKKFDTTNFNTIGGNGNFSTFHVGNALVWGFAINTNYQHGYDIPDKKQTQSNQGLYLDSLVASNGDVNGLLGKVNKQDRWRFSLSIPMFPKFTRLYFKNKDSIQLAFIPYYTFFGPPNSHFTKLLGMYINASQGTPLFINNSNIVGGIGVGFDWVQQTGKNFLSSFSIFIGGTFNVDTFFKHSKPQAEKTNSD